MRNKRFLVGVSVGILCSTLSIGGFYIATRSGNIQALEVPEVFEKIADTSEYDKTKIAILDTIINKYYINQDESFEAVEGIYKGYVYGLEDPYTTYLSAEDFKKTEAEEKGNYVGVGIRFAWGITNQHLIVTEVIEGSPAEKHGMKVGDKIIEIDGIKAMASNEVEIYEKLVYAGEESVQYTVVDNNGENKRELDLVPKEVEIKLVHSEMVDSVTGYINLDLMAKVTATEVEQAVERLTQEGATQLVLDLRSVYSNELEEAIAVADLFLEEGVICSVENKQGEKTTYTATAGSVAMPLALLTDGATSGVVEAMVSALKVKESVLVVGEKTAGHGTLQEHVALGDGSGLSIATAMILDSEDKKIRENPIEPTIVQRAELEATLELVTTGKIDKMNDTVLQKALENLQ